MFNKTLTAALLAAILITAFCFSVEAIEDKSLVLYFSFNEGNGDVVKDLSQYKNDGTIEGNTEWVDGKFGKALRFDGATGYIEVPHSDSLNVESAFTVENWAYPIDTSREQNVAEKGFWVGSWLDHIKTVRGYVFAIAASDWNPIWLATSADSALEAEQWYHLAVTWDGTSRKLYVNGNLDGQDEPAGNLTPNEEPLYIAGGRDPYYYNGIYDEIRIWNRALSGDEINESMNMGREQIFAINPMDKLATSWGRIKKISSQGESNE